MPKKATVRYRSLRSNLVHLPLSLYASLAQQQARPQGLILHLSPLIASSSRVAPKAAYLGWSGLAAASSLAGIGAGAEGETVEVDPEVAMGLGWPEGTIVEISVIHNPTKARSVSVTPMSPDDWEILEQHASFLENNLLSQLRATQKGQEINIWVLGRTKIRIRVGKSSRRPCWVELTRADETDPPTSSSSAVVIGPDTEVFVAPRPRGAQSQTSAAVPIAPSAPKNSIKGKQKQVELRLVPARVAAVWGYPTLSPEHAERVGTSEAALCSLRTLRRVRRKLGLPAEDSAVYVKVERVKDEESGTDRNGEDHGGADAVEDGDATEVWLVSWSEMPDSCVVLSGRRAEWDEWGGVRLSSATPKKPRTKGSKLGSVKALIDLPGPPPSRPLAGSTALIETACAYLRQSFHSERARPLLLLGAKGSGKTSIVKAIGTILECDRDILGEMVYEDVARMDAEGKLGEIKEKMTDWFETTSRRRPCVLVLDGLDVLLGPENELTPSQQPTILADHFARLVSSLPTSVIVVVTATAATSLHPMLSSKHLFGETLKITLPNKEIRAEILQTLVEERDVSQESHKNARVMVNGHQESSLDYVTIASSTEGYSPADLQDLVAGAAQQSMIRSAKSGESKLHLTHEDFDQAQAEFTPLSLRGVSLQKSEVKWGDIGGLHHTRQVLRETLEWPTKYAQIFANCPLRLRSGLLLYGYPGCGKTLLASAVARECGLNFISVKGPEILNKYIGASEAAVRDLFERASAAKPCVLFFDEFDSIAPKRGHDSTGVTDRVVNQMLTEMDGAQGLEGVYVLAATSRPDLIDPALLRPGRLDKSLLCDMPDMAERLEILRALSKKLSLGHNVMLDQIAAETDGLSGADLQAMLYNAHLEVVQSSIAAWDVEKGIDGGVAEKAKDKGKSKGKGKAAENGGPVSDKPTVSSIFRQLAPVEELSRQERATMESRIGAIVGNANSRPNEASVARKEAPKPVIEHVHLLRSLASTRPSVSASDRTRLHRIYKSFVSDRDGAMADGDLGHETGTRVSLM